MWKDLRKCPNERYIGRALLLANRSEMGRAGKSTAAGGRKSNFLAGETEATGWL